VVPHGLDAGQDLLLVPGQGHPQPLQVSARTTQTNKQTTTTRMTTDHESLVSVTHLNHLKETRKDRKVGMKERKEDKERREGGSDT
jgi:hypothetical protein